MRPNKCASLNIILYPAHIVGPTQPALNSPAVGPTSTTVHPKTTGFTSTSRQETVLPHAFTAGTLHDPTTGTLGTWIQDFMTRQVLLRCDSTEDLYPLTAPSQIHHAFLAGQHTWHQHLGHSGSNVLRRLVSNSFISYNKEKPLTLCHASQLGKHVRLSFVNSDSIVNSSFDITHSDETVLPHAFTAGTLHDPITGTLGTWIQDFMTRRVLLRCDSTEDLYPLTDPSPIPHAFLAGQHTWHQHLGHSGSNVLRRLVSNSFISYNKEKSPTLCHAC
nr:ribonuclease H-like domain-containing protein [Tanacetum cinerariifolium]